MVIVLLAKMKTLEEIKINRNALANKVLNHHYVYAHPIEFKISKLIHVIKVLYNFLCY